MTSKLAVTFVSLALAAPLGAPAQVSYSNAAITGPAVVVPGGSCAGRQVALEDRQAGLEQERIANGRELDAIDREGARLAEDQRNLNPSDVAAVADLNARTAEHNRRVDSHNRRIADMNAAAVRLNGELADLSAACNVPLAVR